MERRRRPLNGLDRVYLERACELAARGRANTAPNPPVGAVLVRGGKIVGEGYHHLAGEAHAEAEALRQAGDRAKGATLYVSLEPCNHAGKTPPCSGAVIGAGISRVVIGALDPNPKTARGGVLALEKAGIDVTVANLSRAQGLIEPFAFSIRNAARPYTVLKMGVSIDGYVAPKAGVQHWLTGAASKRFVRDLRTAYDAVLVGAGTIRVDNPHLTVRPGHARLRPYLRIVACETESVPADRNVFAETDGYARTILLAPAGRRDRFEALHAVADVLFIGGPDAQHLDLAEAMHALRLRGVTSVLCEGGPTLAGHLLTGDMVDRLFWLVAPVILGVPNAVKALELGSSLTLPRIEFDSVERLEEDILLSAAVKRV